MMAGLLALDIGHDGETPFYPFLFQRLRVEYSGNISHLFPASWNTFCARGAPIVPTPHFLLHIRTFVQLISGVILTQRSDCLWSDLVELSMLSQWCSSRCRLLYLDATRHGGATP